jgi:hypothetical protein
MMMAGSGRNMLHFNKKKICCFYNKIVLCSCFIDNLKTLQRTLDFIIVLYDVTERARTCSAVVSLLFVYQTCVQFLVFRVHTRLQAGIRR